MDILLDELLATYRGWDQLERTLNPNGQAIIDFDLAQDKSTSFEFRTRLDVLVKLQQLKASLPPYLMFLQERTEASIYYLSALMGQQFPFDTYISSTMGIKPYLFPEEVIYHQREKVRILLNGLNIEFDKKDARQFEERFLISDENEFGTRLLNAKDDALKNLSTLVNLPKIPTINLRFKREDAYWQNWISGSPSSGVTLTVNLHPRGRLYDGIPELLAYHEICGHAVQMSTWLERIRRGELHPVYGITMVHSPEQFIGEGLAQSITDILFKDFELPSKVLMARDYERYRLMVYNNAHIMINTHGSIETVFQFVNQNVPFESASSIEAELKDRSYHPLLRAYQYVYGVSEDFFLRNIAKLDWDQKMALMPLIYKEPLTKRGLEDILGKYQIAK